MDKPSPDQKGHRARLREKLVMRSGQSLADYEILEMLLFAAHPRGDTKPLAKTLLRQFGTLSKVLTASSDKLKEVSGMGEAAIAALKIVPEAAQRLTREEAMAAPVISSWQKLLDYCRITLAHEEVESFHLLFLDRKLKLIGDEKQQRGTVDHTPVYPREVVKRALDLGASALILVHNHPSGDPTPSKSDVEMTREVRDAAQKLGIDVHDHIIVSRSGHASFKALGLI